MQLTALYLSLEDGHDLEPADRQDAARYGARGDKPFSWPVFRSMQPGQSPARLTGTECRTMIHLIEQTINVCERTEEDISLLDPPRRKGRQPKHPLRRLLTRVQQEQADGRKIWVDEYREIEPSRNRFVSVKLGEPDEDDRLNGLPHLEGWTLEIDSNYVNAPLQDDKGQIYYPNLLTAVDAKEVAVFHLVSDEQVSAQWFVQQLLLYFTANGKLPQRFLVRKQAMRYLVQNISDSLNIDLVEQLVLPETHRLTAGMDGKRLQDMLQVFPFDSEEDDDLT